MPGVPSSRGCEACRKQKKRCDQKKPCSRCSRLNILCVGSGQQRFTFKAQSGRSPSRSNSEERRSSYDSESGIVKIVPYGPTNDLNASINAFVATIHTSTDLRFNLAWSYGGFLEEIPRRLISCPNEALEAAVAALTHAHHDVCSQRRASTDGLAKYVRALGTLRRYLNDPSKASTSETLCAVILLLICQGFIGTDSRCWTGHCEGAARMLKARRFYDPNDDFESKLLLSLRGPVVLGGLFNPKIQFTADEWESLIRNHLDGTTHGGLMLSILSQLPDFMKRGKQLRQHGESSDPQLKTEMWTSYNRISESLDDLRQRLMVIEQRLHNDKDLNQQTIYSQAKMYLQRGYGFAATAAIMLGVVLGVVDTEATNLKSELTFLSKENLSLAPIVAKDRPLGANYMQLYLSVAFMGTENRQVRSYILDALADFQSDFAWTSKTAICEADLEQALRILRLEE